MQARDAELRTGAVATRRPSALRSRLLGIRDENWLQFVARQPSATLFHHPAWVELIAESYRFRAFTLTLVDEAGRLVAGLPVLESKEPFRGRRWISLPFTDYLPVLIDGVASEPVLEAMAAEVLSRGIGALEVHAELPSHRNVYPLSRAVRHTLTLRRSEDELFDGFSKMHQRNIRKAERMRVHVEMGSSLEELDAFYHLHLVTRQRHGVPIQPKRFFLMLHERILHRRLGSVMTAVLDGTPVAAAVFLHWNGALIYKYGASDPTYWQYRPNNLLFWHAIRWGCQNSYHTLDWGRSDLSNRGLREFKNGWGSTEEPLSYAVIAASQTAASSRVQVSIPQWLVSATIRRSPRWVCRVMGELFYRYAT